MDEVDGLSFFFLWGRLFGLHAHQPGDSCAMDSYARNFTNRQRRVVVWVYVPIPKPDRPLLLGIRELKQPHTQSIVIRTKLAGDIFAGMQCIGSVRDVSLGASAPLTIIYGEPKLGNPVFFFGVHCRVGPNIDPLTTQPFRLPTPSSSPIGDKAYFSWASLSRVSTAMVFYDDSTRACKGILLHYKNGGARAVGQCRLQLDPAEEIAHPTQFCFKTDISTLRFNRKLYAVRVKFKQDPLDHSTSEVEGWASHRMEGILKFWFSPESCFVVVDN